MPRYQENEYSRVEAMSETILQTVRLCLRYDCKDSKELFRDVEEAIPYLQVSYNDFNQLLFKFVIDEKIEQIADDLYTNTPEHGGDDYYAPYKESEIEQMPGFAKFLIQSDEGSSIKLYYYFMEDKSTLHSTAQYRQHLAPSEWIQLLNRGKGVVVCAMCLNKVKEGSYGIYLCTECHDSLRKIPGATNEVARVAIYTLRNRTTGVPITKFDIEEIRDFINLEGNYLEDDLPF